MKKIVISPGDKAIITCLECADDALEGREGTQIVL
jgi:carbamate kinase